MWGASPASLSTLELMARTFPGADIVSAYGQTEMSGATTLLKGPDATRKMGSVGRPMLNVELRLVDEQLEDVDPGVVGEIVYRGPMVMEGYLGLADATAEAFAGGWFHSGDLATRDEEGYLRLVDRKKDMIVSGGENVYPAEVERVLRDHPAVADVAVIGVAHPRWVETPVAFVVAADGRPRPRVRAGRALPRAPRRLQEAVGGLLRRSAPSERGGEGRQAGAARPIWHRAETKLKSCHNRSGRARTSSPFPAPPRRATPPPSLRCRPGPATRTRFPAPSVPESRGASVPHRAAIVTGASRGIGLALAETLAAEG